MTSPPSNRPLRSSFPPGSPGTSERERLNKVPQRIYLLKITFTLLGSLLLSWAVPFLLLLGSPVRDQVTLTLFAALVAGGIASVGVCAVRMRRIKSIFKVLASDDPNDKKRIRVGSMTRLLNEPGFLTRAWFSLHALSMLVFLTPFRPKTMDETEAVTVLSLCALLIATASLPLQVLLRHTFLIAVDAAPASVMRQLTERTERSRESREYINRKIVAAVATPLILVTLGCALIVNAHLRRDGEQTRMTTANALAEGALVPLALESGSQAGADELNPSLGRALKQAKKHGFPTEIWRDGKLVNDRVEDDGLTLTSTTTEKSTVEVHFSTATVGVLSPAPALIALLAAVATAVLGFLVGNLLSTDLYYATRGVRRLGTNAGFRPSDTAVIPAARLRVVDELSSAIERLAGRFTVFAKAQEHAIGAKAATTRMRGLFFASVSHDLKSPLNSILGFTQLVTLEPLTPGQTESVEAILTRARELLALIETILDAARVEEGQLALKKRPVAFNDIHRDSISKAKEIWGDHAPHLLEEFDDHIPPLIVDRTRVVRAFATLIAYSVKSNAGGQLWLRVERDSDRSMRFDIDVPNPAHPPQELEAMLSPGVGGQRKEHRGLALGLRLARSVVELHGGGVRVFDRGKKGAMFSVRLPTDSRSLPSAPTNTVPPPPDQKDWS